MLTGSSKLSKPHILPLLLHNIPAQKTWTDPEPVVGELMGLCISVQFISCVISEWLQKPIGCVLNYTTPIILFQDDQTFTTTTDYYIRSIQSPKMTNFKYNYGCVEFMAPHRCFSTLVLHSQTYRMMQEEDALKMFSVGEKDMIILLI